MYKVITEQFYQLPPVSQKEVFRYTGMKGEPTAALLQLYNECLDLAKDTCSGKICYCEFEKEDFLAALPLAKESQAVIHLLASADSVVVFVATVGIAIDRMIQRFVNVSPLKALLFQALGAERIEAVCNLFCSKLRERYEKDGLQVSPRFSAGYGDFPLTAQKDIFRLLSPEKYIGVSLTDSLLMTPSKSVSAFVAVGKKQSKDEKSCNRCSLKKLRL